MGGEFADGLFESKGRVSHGGINESTKMIGAEITKAGFEGTSTSRKQDKKGISFSFMN